jgi:hypothetical protein
MITTECFYPSSSWTYLMHEYCNPPHSPLSSLNLRTRMIPLSLPGAHSSKRVHPRCQTTFLNGEAVIFSFSITPIPPSPTHPWNNIRHNDTLTTPGRCRATDPADNAVGLMIIKLGRGKLLVILGFSVWRNFWRWTPNPRIQWVHKVRIPTLLWLRPK